MGGIDLLHALVQHIGGRLHAGHLAGLPGRLQVGLRLFQRHQVRRVRNVLPHVAGVPRLVQHVFDQLAVATALQEIHISPFHP